jgi:ArsR family transcriptional regulator
MMELLLRALADTTRLRLLNLMRDDEVCVCFFVEVLGISQPKISRHLAYLRRAGLVAARRQWKWMHYRIVNPADSHTARILQEVQAWLAQNPQMQRERAKLIKICCSPKSSARLQGAQRPLSLST